MGASPTPVPWLKWPPPRNVTVGGVSFIVSWILLSIAAHFGYDPQPIVDTITGPMGAPHFDVLAAVAGLIGFLIAHYTTPSVRDIVDRVNNGIVKIANADPDNPTTAAVVDGPTSDAAAMHDVRAGFLPAAVAAKTIAAIGP